MFSVYSDFVYLLESAVTRKFMKYVGLSLGNQRRFPVVEFNGAWLEIEVLKMKNGVLPFRPIPFTKCDWANWD